MTSAQEPHPIFTDQHEEQSFAPLASFVLGSDGMDALPYAPLDAETADRIQAKFVSCLRGVKALTERVFTNAGLDYVAHMHDPYKPQ